MSLDVPSYVPDDLWTHADLHLSEHQPLFWKMTALQQTSRTPFSFFSFTFQLFQFDCIFFFAKRDFKFDFIANLALDIFTWVSKS